MRALVTGAAGFIGGHLVDELLRRGDAVAGLLRPSRQPPASWAGAVDVVRADLRRPGPELDAALERTDVVYHTTVGGGSWREAYEGTVAATERLLDAMRRTSWQGRLVHVSSFAVYAWNQIPAGSRIDEDSPLEPEPGRRNDYSWVKLLQERLVREFAADAGCELVVVRPGAVYGPGRTFPSRVGRQIGSRVVLVLGGRNPMPLNYVDNTASLLAESGRHPLAAGQTFNAVDHEPPTQREYLRRWVAAAPDRVVVVPMPLPVLTAAMRVYGTAAQRSRGRVRPPVLLQPYVMRGETRAYTYAPSRAEAMLGWIPPVSPAEALRRTFGSSSS